MRALWRGMTSVPWEGPPAPDARGFLSVIAQAASNPDLDPARASSFQERSFFLISKDFCSLHSRFGFHFSIIEALLGDSPAESYASMRFKGGAADPERRARRAHMVGEVLRDMGFSVDVRRDALTARIEGVEPAELEARLEALGFLSLHTRQMDMVMGDPVRTGECRARLLRGLAALPGGGGLAAPAAPGSSGPQDASAPTDATAGRTTA
jgi:pyruvate,water dikinase